MKTVSNGSATTTVRMFARPAAGTFRRVAVFQPRAELSTAVFAGHLGMKIRPVAKQSADDIRLVLHCNAPARPDINQGLVSVRPLIKDFWQGASI
jgi:hypothetical protein